MRAETRQRLEALVREWGGFMSHTTYTSSYLDGYVDGVLKCASDLQAALYEDAKTLTKDATVERQQNC